MSCIWFFNACFLSVLSGGQCGRRVLCQRRRPQVKVQGRAHHLPLGALQRLVGGIRTQSGWSQIPSGGETSSDTWHVLSSGISYMSNVNKPGPSAGCSDVFWRVLHRWKTFFFVGLTVKTKHLSEGRCSSQLLMDKWTWLWSTYTWCLGLGLIISSFVEHQVPSYCSVDSVFRTVCCGCHFVLLITLMENNRNKKQQHFVHFADLWHQNNSYRRRCKERDTRLKVRARPQ